MHVHCRRPLVAKYHNIGCKVMLRSEDEDEHDEACMKEHLQLMSEHLIATKEEITKLMSIQTFQELSKLMSKLESH